LIVFAFAAKFHLLHRYLSAKFYLGKRNFNAFAYLHRLLGKFILTGKNRAHFTEIDYL